MTFTPSQDADLQALYDVYAVGLPAKIKDIEVLWAHVAACGEREAAQSLHRALHSLAGAGETFGYSQLGKSAQALEMAITALLDGATLPRDALECLAPLLDELKRAAAAPDVPGT